MTNVLFLRSTGLFLPDLLLRDQDHLTPSGSRLLMAAAVPQIFGPPLAVFAVP
jgi:hypothetical protein